jgi:hypothetical protein
MGPHAAAPGSHDNTKPPAGPNRLDTLETPNLVYAF